ncbi:hypothetical protein BPNPMPFG_006528 (plasmid) [Mesorhizobium sp. AR07]|uniref:hypothetical protein n=1 Tax=Mesorhizobium sp. AR07 TaxID=2865838 RepID=UPI0016178288|nr:hypothetical protein [Mesorhizobium sp. AR07]QND69429.1 hypothetical protein HB777_37790 [Mesorhizobium loti]UVK48920.1 hypothetical protein BPNPMPFG_006528 [Mesorhizobium sp. AR07]
MKLNSIDQFSMAASMQEYAAVQEQHPGTLQLIPPDATPADDHGGHPDIGGSMRMPPRSGLRSRDGSLWSRVKSAVRKAVGECCVGKPSSGSAQASGKASSSVLRSDDIGYLVGPLWDHHHWDNGGQLMPREIIRELGKLGFLPGQRNQEQPAHFEINGEHYTAEVKLTPNSNVVFGQSREVYLIHHPPRTATPSA